MTFQALFFRVALLAVSLLSPCCHGITMAPTPSDAEMLKMSKLVGIVKILAVPTAPAAGFTAETPPVVSVSVTTSLSGLARDTTLNLLWDSGIRYDQLASFTSGMLRPLSETHITPPNPGDEYFVFLEEHKPGLYRDIYGWKKRKVVPVMLDVKETEMWSWVMLKPAPLTFLPRAQSSYNRQKYLYESTPVDDARTRVALGNFQVEEPGEYWVLTDDTAVLCRYLSKRINPDWPCHHVVAPGDTLTKIAEKYYRNEGRWPKILEANRSLIPDPRQMKLGTKLLIPPEKEKPTPSARNSTSPAIILECTGNKWDVYGNFLNEFQLRNVSGRTIHYFGYSVSSPVYSTQFKRAGVWREKEVGWCGTGLSGQDLASGQAATFTESPPDGNATWRIGVRTFWAVNDKNQNDEFIAWSPALATRTKSQIDALAASPAGLAQTGVTTHLGQKYPYTFTLLNCSTNVLFYGGYVDDVPPIYLHQELVAGRWKGDGHATWCGEGLGFQPLPPGKSITFSIPGQSLKYPWRIGLQLYRTASPQNPEDAYEPIWWQQLPPRKQNE